MNRRTFLRALGIGAATLGIPSALLPAPVLSESRTWALDYLTREWNEHTRGTGAAHQPAVIVVGSDLYEAVKSEMIGLRRVVQWEPVDPHAVLFKTAKLRAEGRGWTIKRFEARVK